MALHAASPDLVETLKDAVRGSSSARGGRFRAALIIGEVALSGAIRPVGRIEPRLREAARLGFSRAFVPAGAPDTVDGMAVHGLSRLQDLVDVLGGDSE